MNSHEKQLAEDLVAMSALDFAKRYKGKVPDGTTIKGVIDVLQTRGLLNALIRSDWRNDGKDQDGLYFFKEGACYQVFMGERGIKHLVKEFQDLNSACTAWVDSVFNQHDYLAPDSTIG